MKVTRLNKGYRISLSDADYRMLLYLVVDGLAAHEGDDFARTIWQPAEKAALTRRLSGRSECGGNVLRIDRDLRLAGVGRT